METIDEKLLNLVEDTTTANDPNISASDYNLIPDHLFQQTLLPSLGRQIFSVIPIKGPNAGV